MEKNILYDPFTHTRQYRWLGFTTFMGEQSRRVGSRVQTAMDVARTALRSGSNRRGKLTLGRSMIATQLLAPSAFKKLVTH